MPEACDLCGLPAAATPLTRDFGAEHRTFCCFGCMNVYTILRESGVLQPGVDVRDTALFRESLRLGLVANGAAAARPEIPPDAEIKESVYHVGGMWCASCAWLIEEALASEPGVRSAQVLFASDLLRVKYCPQYIPPGRIDRRVASLGYRLAPYESETERDHSERRDLLLRTGIAAFLWMNVMAISLVNYASYWEAISDTAGRVVPLVLLALTTPAVFYSAWPILRIAARGALAGALRMEALVGLGILAAYGYSAVQAVAAGTHYYFDSVCAIVTLVLVGKLLERSAKEKAANAIALLYRMMPNKARVITGPGQHDERFGSIEALAAGMHFLVKPGERVPADGIVVEGDSHVDESVVTGESAPVSKQPGDSLTAGSLNMAGVLKARATRVGADSTLHHMARAVEAAATGRSQTERAVDRAARLFVPALIVISLLTFAGCAAVGIDPTAALLRAIAVLVIACPCALGIATPLAITLWARLRAGES